MHLPPNELRVLGCLIEKEITTPENYPLSLNALLNACNQRSSRDPILDLDEEQVRQALHTLEELQLVTPYRDARVAKYEHRARTVLNLRRDETAILCLLLLRGPQTPGELRTRADRMFAFDDLASVVSTLERLAARSTPDSEASPSDSGSTDSGSTGPLVVLLARQPGSSVARYAHLLGDIPAPSAQGDQPGRDRGSDRGINQAATSPLADKVADLEVEINQLREMIRSLEQRIQQFE
jgi:uncharacterized protein YceH (UPF0502 family)